MSARGVARGLIEATGAALWRMPCGPAPELFLTFDDGPHPVHTQRVVEMLDRLGVRACFFMSGAEAQRYTEIVPQVLEAGHGVANHGFFHLSARHLSGSGYVANALHAQATLENAAGRRLPRLFRPPHGSIPARGLVALWRRGFRFVLWSRDSGDSEPEGRVARIETNLTPGRVAAGEIILLHDDHAAVVEALPRIIVRLRQAGYRFGRLDEALVPGAEHGAAAPVAVGINDRGESCAG